MNDDREKELFYGKKDESIGNASDKDREQAEAEQVRGYMQGLFVQGFNAVATDVHDTVVVNGFWESGHGRNDAEMIALMHSELSEALESIRSNYSPDDKLPEFSGAEVELADCIVRIMDMAQGRGLRVAEALIAKIEYNKTRPYKHGRSF